MREAIGGTWLFIIVIAFVMLFTGYLCLAINYSRAYNVKNEIVDIIERENGLTEEAENDIAEYLQKVGYRTRGKCDDDFIGNATEKVTVNGQHLYCYKVFEVAADNEDQAYSVYYQISVFFRVDLPIMRDMFTFPVKGDSIQLFYPKEG